MNIILKVFIFWVLLFAISYIAAKIGYKSQGRGGYNWKYYKLETDLGVLYSAISILGTIGWIVFLIIKLGIWWFSEP